MGHLVIANVSNFKITGSSQVKGNVTISCQPDATLGFTFLLSHNVEISNIKISKCSAAIYPKSGSGILDLALKADYKNLNKYLKHNFTFCGSKHSDNQKLNNTLCYVSVAAFGNIKISIHRTVILHSRGVGMFSLGNKYFNLSESILESNEVNFITFITSNTSSTFSVSDSNIMYGRIRPTLYLASGLNLFIHLGEQSHNINITRVKFENNIAQFGNIYMVVYIHSMYRIGFVPDIEINIFITNITSVQSLAEAMFGYVEKFDIDLRRSPSSIYTYDYEIECHQPKPLIYNSRYGGYWDVTFPNEVCERVRKLIPPSDKPHRNVTIILQSGHFIGGCISVIDSKIQRECATCTFEMKNITIVESKCLTALGVVNSDVRSSIKLTNLSIIGSLHDIVSIDVGDNSLFLNGKTSFMLNRGSIVIQSGEISFDGVTNITSNSAHNHESVFLISESSKVRFLGITVFVDNLGRQGGAISAYSANLYFHECVIFAGNTADNGGAISLREGSIIHLTINAYITFKGNIAMGYGGAIYVDDDWMKVSGRRTCFLQTTTHDTSQYKVELENNRAGISGSVLFGGMIDRCTSADEVLNLAESENINGTTITSNPYQVCVCTNSTIGKCKKEVHIDVFPGQTFNIEVATVGQRYGVVPASVRAKTDFNVIDDLQKVQDTQNRCTMLKYTLRSSNRYESMVLRIEQQNNIQNISFRGVTMHEVRVLIHLHQCPLGFEFVDKFNSCMCSHYLLEQGVKCNYSSFTVNRNAHQWIGRSRVSNQTTANDITVHQHCPHDYCKSYIRSLNLSSPDDQCNYKRSGILCGACQPGLSQVLGTSKCKKCSNLWLLLTVVFAVAGALLVAALMLLNLTVTTGTINGLIFYANIVRANNAAFFPEGMSSSFLGWFIAWLNLDLGVETCFYDGLDAYVKTWLQFAFPLYIWLLVAIIIVSSKYSKKVAKIFSKNAVQVLATLFILSYAKLLRLTILIFQPTQIAGGYLVWHYDGNIDYFGKKHILLMIVGLTFFLLFFIPYTVILFGIQCLQRFSHYKVLCWVNKFKPLFDAYTGPYKDNHHYWTGLLLLVRILLFIVFSTNVTGDPSTNLLAIIIVTTCLFAYLALFAGVYKTWLLNVLEYSFFLNLIIVSAAALYATSTNGAVRIVTLVSVSTTLSISGLIVAYKCFTAIVKILKFDKKVGAMYFWKKKELETTGNVRQNVALLDHVTHSVVELKEPLLEY